MQELRETFDAASSSKVALDELLNHPIMIVVEKEALGAPFDWTDL